MHVPCHDCSRVADHNSSEVRIVTHWLWAATDEYTATRLSVLSRKWKMENIIYILFFCICTFICRVKPLATTPSTHTMPSPRMWWVCGSKPAGPTRAPPPSTHWQGSKVWVNLHSLDLSTPLKPLWGSKGVGSNSDPSQYPPWVTRVAECLI